MSKLVSVRLMGGLGNQLFQIFATLAYGLNHNRTVIFPYSDSLKIGMERPTYWNTLLNNLKRMTTSNIMLGIKNSAFSRFSNLSEHNFTYHELPDVHYKEVLLNGYFQSYKYFDDTTTKNHIFSLIDLKEQQDRIKRDFSYLFPKNKQSISMHFRLGDYLHLQDKHPIMKYEYYEKALEYIISFNEEKEICILYFCQEEDNTTVSLIIEKLKQKYTAIEFIKVDDTIPDWKQMLLMSQCNHNIIANSTFSWWGAYLRPYDNGIVCYPSIWFGQALHHNTNDLFPENWHRIL
jgi:hypothetical protein